MATSSCSLLVHSGSVWVWPHIYHFYLTMECCCVPVLWLGGETTSSSWQAVQVTYCYDLWSSNQSLLRPWRRLRAVSEMEACNAEDGKALLQNPYDLDWNSPIGTCQTLQTASLCAADTLGTLDLTGHKAQMADQLTQQPGNVAEPSLFLGPT